MSPISPSPSPSPVQTGDSIRKVASTLRATPRGVYSPVLPTPQGAASHRITKVLVSNIATRASAVEVQVFFGVRYAVNGGSSNWEPIAAPILGVGDTAAYDVDFELVRGDELVSYADIADVATVSFLVEVR